MAISDRQDELIAEAGSTGLSPHITLPPRRGGGRYILAVRSSGAFVADLQRANDGSDFTDVYEQNTKVTINTGTPTAQDFEVPAGSYRLNVTTYNSAITMYAQEA